MVSITGSSNAYRPMDDGNVIVTTSEYSNVFTAHDLVVHSNQTILGNHNLLIGKGNEADANSKNNLVISEGVKLLNGAENVISIGRPNRRITNSNFTEIGEFLFYDGTSETLKLLSDAVVAQKGGDVQIGGENGLTVRRNEGEEGGGMELAAPIRLIEHGVGGWTFDLALAENAPEGVAEAEDMRDLVLRSDKGATIVFSDQFTPAITNFTGQHRCILRQNEDKSPPIGTVLISTGDYCGLDGQDLSVDEAIPVVTESTAARDVRVFGVLSSIEDFGATRRVKVGNIAFDRPKDIAERRVVVNGSGEGGILVCSEGGDIENGDYLCTSSRSGLAMKQSEPYKCKFTCGKATTSVRFTSSDPDPQPLMIGCIYA